MVYFLFVVCLLSERVQITRILVPYSVLTHLLPKDASFFSWSNFSPSVFLFISYLYRPTKVFELKPILKSKTYFKKLPCLFQLNILSSFSIPNVLLKKILLLFHFMLIFVTTSINDNMVEALNPFSVLYSASV